ncbi:winged helix-turn-helix transcriptional regulator [Chitinophaga polysaccharea]|uniref:winged helix-turn-helix transcriptional regulator n=1 Tax=Chitinophaga polysaccharea TaxID=1293035 RepID=UPI001158B6E5|nr:helix-turn-helix domain-containing protein [Chitinophaga polysaccharea]
MTTRNSTANQETCPAQALLKLLSGKYKAEIFRLATAGPVRFSSLLRDIPEANRQSISVALRELEEHGLLKKDIIKNKPLHIEYQLSPRGVEVISVFKQLEGLIG